LEFIERTNLFLEAITFEGVLVGLWEINFAVGVLKVVDLVVNFLFQGDAMT